MNKSDFIYKDFNCLNDIDLLSEKIDINNTDTFKCGKLIDESEKYNKWSFIDNHISKVENVDCFLQDLYYNKVIKQYYNKPYIDLQNLTFIGNQPYFFKYKASFYMDQYYGYKDFYNNKMFTNMYEELYNGLIDSEDDCFSESNSTHVSCVLNQYWQYNKGEKETFFILKYMANQPGMYIFGEYDVSIEFHNKIATKLCQELTKKFNITIYPSYIEYNIGIACFDVHTFEKINNY